MRNACIAACLGLALLPATAAGSTRERLPPDASIAGVAVGGLGPHGARVELQRQLAPVFESPIRVRVYGHRHISVPTARLGQVIRYADMVDAAYAQFDRGDPVHVRMMRAISGTQLTAAVSALGRPFYRAPRNARVRLGITHVRLKGGRTGRALDLSELRRKLLSELRRPTGRRRVWGHVRWTKPSVRKRDLRRLYPTYVSVSRPGRTVRLFKRLRLVRRYTVAVGAAGYDTPAGLHHVLSKQVNPTWYVPNRPWAGSLAGQTIPPGDSRNPLKARFISLGGGVGFHGTADLASIGQAASHGCIRMRIPDVISLYNRTPVGTPVRIR
jgi:hypothetical protein